MFYRVQDKRFSWDEEGIEAAIAHAMKMAQQLGEYIYVYVCSDKNPIGLSRGAASPDGGYQTAY